MEGNDVVIDDTKTLHGAAINFAMRFGYLIRIIGREIQPDYWVCINCGNIKYVEEEVRCWKCGVGEMIYKGDLK